MNPNDPNQTPPTPPVPPIMQPPAEPAPLPPPSSPLPVSPPQAPTPLQAAPPPAPQTATPPAPKRKLLKSLLVLCVGLLGLIILVLAVMIVVDKPITYSSGDLTTVKAQNFHYGIPKQWQDQSSNASFINSLGFLKSGSGVKVYTYKLVASKNTAQTIYAIHSEIDNTSDAALKQALTSKVQQQELTSHLVSAFSPSILGCKSSSNSQNKAQLNTENYVYQLTISYDCSTTKSTTPIHVAVLVGAKNDYVFSAILLTDKTDWDRNATFYNNTLLPSLTPTT